MAVEAEPHQISGSDGKSLVEGSLLRDIADLVVAPSWWGAVDEDFAR
jgi:hypothetical protein